MGGLRRKLRGAFCINPMKIPARASDAVDFRDEGDMDELNPHSWIFQRLLPAGEGTDKEKGRRI